MRQESRSDYFESPDDVCDPDEYNSRNIEPLKQ
jgi:hypothetical protein